MIYLLYSIPLKSKNKTVYCTMLTSWAKLLLNKPCKRAKKALHVLIVYYIISFRQWSGNLEHSKKLILQERRPVRYIFCKVNSSKKWVLRRYIIMRLVSWCIFWLEMIFKFYVYIIYNTLYILYFCDL